MPAIVRLWLISVRFSSITFTGIDRWLVAVGTLFAIVVAKQLYGGLGQNPFNPAMVAFAVCIVSFPALMSQWPALGLKLTLADMAYGTVATSLASVGAFIALRQFGF